MSLITLFILLFLSAFFSASEFAFVAANRIKIEMRARKNNWPARIVNGFLNDSRMFFSTLLIADTITNIAFAVYSVMLFTDDPYNYNAGWVIAGSVLILFFFGELLPKFFAGSAADSLLYISVLPVKILSFIFYPLVKLISAFSDYLNKIYGIKKENIALLFGRGEYSYLVNENTETGTVDTDDSEVLNKILDLSEQKIYEVMTPRTEIVGVEINSTVEETINILIESGFSKIPVYEENMDNIRGMILTYDMFKYPPDIKSIIREAAFVPETKKSLEMLNEFLEKRLSIAVVVDEFGGTAGIVTIEDIIEELFGEIMDEYDTDEEICRKIDDKTLVLSGRIEIDRLNDEFEMGIPEGDYETIAGYVTSELGRIPSPGEKLVIENYRVLILKSDKTKITLLKLVREK